MKEESDLVTKISGNESLLQTSDSRLDWTCESIEFSIWRKLKISKILL